ncbi:hypothetical protein [Geomicrobium sp. JCM 19039]|uniref:hypothetical protein n=1 Tax=Geomicrobium sp. JCM 19039 TaxID=1460636 RepID=UPI0006939A37|nr:hypothetical protein [Geomicrobium sp. JCM 19039]
MARATTRSLRLQKKRRRRKRVIATLITLASVALIAIGAGLGYATWKTDQFVSDTDIQLDRGSVSKQREAAVDPAVDNISVLFLGVDDRSGEVAGISDAMILATFNHSEDL